MDEIKTPTVPCIPNKNIKINIKKDIKNKNKKNSKNNNKTNNKKNSKKNFDTRYINLLSNFNEFYNTIQNGYKYNKQQINDCYYNIIMELDSNDAVIDDNEIYKIISDNLKISFPGLLFKSSNNNIIESIPNQNNFQVSKSSLIPEDTYLIINDEESNESDGNTTDDNSDDSSEDIKNDIKIKDEIVTVNNDEEVNNLINKLKDKSNEKLLIPYIPKLKSMFADKLNNLSSAKRKLILIYFSIFNSRIEHFHYLFPTLLFQNESGFISNFGVKKENNVTIFHMEYIFGLLKTYVYGHLNYNNKHIINDKKLRIYLGKLIFQYISIFNVSDQHYLISIMKNNNFEHYLKILKFHIHCHYPNFDESTTIDTDKLDFVKSDIDRYILKVRLLTSNVLSRVDVITTRYGIIKDVFCKYIDNKFYDHNNDELNSELSDPTSKIYDIEDIKLNLLNLIMAI